jgi:hypothetical protein
MFRVCVEVLLEPVDTPQVQVTCGNETKNLKLSNGPVWVKFEFYQEKGPARLTVELLDKQPNDPDTAVIVKKIKLNDIEHIQNTYQGMYCPNDKDPRRDTYIAWNGIWALEFSVPVYTWMHQVQGLGWIYD